MNDGLLSDLDAFDENMENNCSGIINLNISRLLDGQDVLNDSHSTNMKDCNETDMPINIPLKTNAMPFNIRALINSNIIKNPEENDF